MVTLQKNSSYYEIELRIRIASLICYGCMYQ